MKKNMLLLLVAIFTINCNSTPNPNSTNPSHLICADYWAAVTFSDFCGMNLSNFDLDGVNDICGADSNDSYANDELIYINVYNNFDEAGAMEEYNLEKEAAESADGYMQYSDIGDEAFAILNVEFGRLDGLYLVARKGIYTVVLDVNGNAANGSNNCFTPGTVFDFAKALVEPL